MCPWADEQAPAAFQVARTSAAPQAFGPFCCLAGSFTQQWSCLPHFHIHNRVVLCTPNGIFGWKVRGTAFHGDVSSLSSVHPS